MSYHRRSCHLQHDALSRQLRGVQLGAVDAMHKDMWQRRTKSLSLHCEVCGVWRNCLPACHANAPVRGAAVPARLCRVRVERVEQVLHFVRLWCTQTRAQRRTALLWWQGVPGVDTVPRVQYRELPSGLRHLAVVALGHLHTVVLRQHA